MSAALTLLRMGAAAARRRALVFAYKPGNAGYSFTRACAATYLDSDAVLQSAGTGVLRDAHYLGGARCTLFESSRTNLLLYTEDFTQAAWAASGVTPSTAQTTAPDGANTGNKLLASNLGNTEHISQVLIASAAASVYVVGVWLKAVDGSNTAADIGIYDDTGSAFPAQTGGIEIGSGSVGAGADGCIRITGLSTTAWTRATIRLNANATAGHQLSLQIYPGARGTQSNKSVYVWGAQGEIASLTSYMKSEGTAGTRSQNDKPSFSMTAGVQAYTAYMKFVELGAIRTANTRIAQIGQDSPSANNRWQLGATNGVTYRTILTNNSGTSATGTVSGTPALGAIVELRAILRLSGGNATVQIGMSINGGAETLGTESGAIAAPVVWNADTLFLGAHNSTNGYGPAALQRLALAKGLVSRDGMRALAG